MKGFDRLHIKSAVKDLNKFHYNPVHLTTMNFGQVVPLQCIELVPRDRFPVKTSFFMRMAPLAKPVFGKFRFKTLAGFVPAYQLADDADAFYAAKTTFAGSVPSLRYFTPQDIWDFFATDGVSVNGSTEDHDYYEYGDSINTPKKFTTIGKFYYKVFTALGYSLPTPCGDNPTYFNAMPLLAFFKLYNDTMSLSTRYNISTLTYLLDCIRHNKAVTSKFQSGVTPRILGAGLFDLFSSLRVAYENDYFTSAWESANSALASGNQTKSDVDVPSSGSQSINDAIRNTTKGVFAGLGTSSAIYQRSLDFLKSFDDFVRRNNYSGSRAVQQIYSRFGIKTEDYRSNYAHLISTSSSPIQIGDVTSTAATDGAELGEYAGKGIMSSSDGFSYESSDYGYLIHLGYVAVDPMTPFGYDRQVLRVDPLDFYNPEFDGLGADAISFGEVYVDPSAPRNATGKDNSVFGFTERFNSYRYLRDKITGDFRDLSANSAIANNWHTARLLTGIRNSGNMLPQSSEFNTMKVVNSEYNRFFSLTDGFEDMFYLSVAYEIDALRPMLSLNQVPNLGEGNVNVEKNGNQVS